MKGERDLLLYGARLLDARRAVRGGAAKGKGRGSPRARLPQEALWIRGDRIVAVGPLAALRSRAGRGAKRVDLGGGMLTPGFTDSHIHLLTWIQSLREPWLLAQDPESIERAARERREAAPNEEWLLLRGWVPREWPEPRRTRALLDRIAPDRPLVLFAVDGHSVWANRAAFERAGLGEGMGLSGRPSVPAGGSFELDSKGRATGALIEEDRKLVTDRVQRATPPHEDLAAALAEARGLGVTSAHDFGGATTWRAAEELASRESLSFRLLLSIPVASLDAAEKLGIAAGLGGDRVRIGPVKMFADGTLGSATALLEEPYEGRSERGIEVTPPDRLAAACRRAAEAGLSVAIHAIGDRAVRNALDAIETAQRAGKPYPLPPRVEHVQLSRVEDWDRFRDLGVIASVQPIHQLTDRAVALKFWGQRTQRAYAWKSLLTAGVKLIFGSDAPFDRAGPLRALQAAVQRREGDEMPDKAFHPEQRLGLAQSLRAHLEEPHRAAGWPVPLGRLAPGYVADLVHFDLDLLGEPPERWHLGRARSVWIGGKRVHGGSYRK